MELSFKGKPPFSLSRINHDKKKKEKEQLKMWDKNNWPVFFGLSKIKQGESIMFNQTAGEYSNNSRSN